VTQIFNLKISKRRKKKN